MRHKLLLAISLSFCLHLTVLGNVGFEALHAIVKNRSTLIEIEDEKHVLITESKTIEILSEKGLEMANLYYFDDQFVKTKSFDVSMVNANGNEIASYSKSHFSSQKVFQGIRYYDELVSYVLDCAHKQFPYTIKYHHVTKMKVFFDYEFEIDQAEHVLTLHSDLTLRCKPDFPIGYKLNGKNYFTENDTLIDGYRSLHFSLESPYVYAHQPHVKNKYIPAVMLVAESNKYGKIAGSLSSWQAYGLWYNELNQGRSELPDQAKAEIERLVVNHQSEEEKARAIYKYVQNRLRYVYVGYGLGGLQTMLVEDTYKNGYSDCKGLTYFTKAALNHVGIEAIPALVLAGDKASFINPNRPMNAFNHIFLCLPQINDTTWLECTSSTWPFGYISDFTDDRYVLLLTPEGGELTKSPKFEDTDNLILSKFEITLRPNIDAHISFQGAFKNLAVDNSYFAYGEKQKMKPEDVLRYEWTLRDFEVKSYEADLYADDKAQLTVNVEVNSKNFGRRVGNKVIVKPFINKVELTQLDSNETRLLPLYFKHGFIKVDSVLIHIPDTHGLQSMPDDMRSECVAGTMEITFWAGEHEHEVWARRRMIFRAGSYDAEHYRAICRFLSDGRLSNGKILVLEQK